MAPRIERLGVLYAKIEATPGTDSVPTGTTDPVIAYNVKITPKHEFEKRPDLAVTKSNLKELRGKSSSEISFEVELRSSGTAGTAPKGIGALLQACDLTETLVSVTSATYTPNSGTLKTCTIYLYLSGKRYILTFCVGDVELSMVAGKVARLKFKFSALYMTPTDQAVPAAPTYDTTVPVVCKNLVATFDSFAAVIRECTLKMNNKVVERADLTAPDGVRGFDISDREPDGEISVEATLLATKNFYTKFEANTVQVLSVVVGTVAGNIATITANQCLLRNIPEDSDGGILVHKLPFQMSRSSVDDEFSLTLT